MQATLESVGLGAWGGSPEAPRFWLATGIYAATYLAIIFEKWIGIDRIVAALFGSSLMLFFVLRAPQGGHAGTFVDTYGTYVDFNVVFLLVGMMIIVHVLRQTGVFEYVAIRCAKAGGGRPLPALALLLLTTAFVSSLLDNVTTVIMIAPVTMIVATQLRIDPVSFLIPIALASNIGGTATLIGDPPNIMIGSFAGLDFMLFLKHLGPLTSFLVVLFVGGIFLAMRGGMKASAECRAMVMDMDESRAINDPRVLRTSLCVTALTIVGFMLHGFLRIEPGVVAMAGAAVMLWLTGADVRKALDSVEWPTLFFFIGLFILTCGAVQVGLLDKISNAALGATGSDPRVVAGALVWLSGIASGIIDNVPFTAACLPVVENIIGQLGLTGAAANVLWWALALGACLGGNLTPIGAAANIVICDLLARQGHPVSFGRFMLYGAPCTLACLSLSTLYVVLLEWLAS